MDRNFRAFPVYPFILLGLLWTEQNGKEGRFVGKGKSVLI